MMKQFYEIKEQHPDAILLFRVGDFYETYADDAVEAAEDIGHYPNAEIKHNT